MHLKITKTRYKGKISRYGKIIETYRESGKIKQKIIRNIGNIKTNEDEKRAEGLLNSLQSGEKYPRQTGGMIFIDPEKDFVILTPVDTLYFLNLAA